MTKKKYKTFIDIVLVFLCLFPLISLLFVVGTSSTVLTPREIATHVSGYLMSTEMAFYFETACEIMGIVESGETMYGLVIALTLMTNTVLIYMFYLLVSFVLWIPKLSINIINRLSGQKY